MQTIKKVWNLFKKRNEKMEQKPVKHNTMIEEFLTRAIHENFDFLIKEFEFEDFLTDFGNRDLCFYYRKKNFLVEIHYNYPNHYIEINFYKETDINKLIGADFIGLVDIIKDKKPEFKLQEYDSIMPKVIPLEESAELVSKLAKEYAPPYLKGEEWKTWKDVNWKT